MFLDKLAQKRYKLENDSAFQNTFQGRVVSVSSRGTEVETPLGKMLVPPSAGDRMGTRRFHIRTSTGMTDSPF